MNRTRSTLLALAIAAAFLMAGAYPEDKAVVYVWKTWHPSTIGRGAFDVFLDEKLIAKLDRGRYFAAHVPAGKHAFRTKTREAGAVELDLQPGQTYYLRMDTTTGLLVGRPVLTHTSAEEGRTAIEQAKPIKPDDIKDRSIVAMDYRGGPPAAAEEPPTEPQKVTVQITSEPTGAEVFVDGEFVGSAPSKLVLPAGPHVVKVERPGFAEWERTVRVRPGAAITINAILAKRDSPP